MLSPRLSRLLFVGAVVVVVFGIVLRFVASSDMWLDEALTLNISRLPLGQIHGALRRDGAPPLYYYLLHFWSGAFGTSDTAVRALSGVLSCATLPFIWLAGSAPGRQDGGGREPSSSWRRRPSPVRYATENRMYALVGLSPRPGVVALQHVFRRRTAANVVAVARGHRPAPLHPLLGALSRRGHGPVAGLPGLAGTRGPPARGARRRWWRCSSVASPSCPGCRPSSIRPTTPAPRGPSRPTSPPWSTP